MGSYNKAVDINGVLLGERLKAMGLNWQEVGIETGKSRDYIRNLVKDKGRTTENYLKLLEKLYKVDLKGIIIGQEIENKEHPATFDDIKGNLADLTMAIRDTKKACIAIAEQLERYEHNAKEIADKIEKSGGILWN